MANLLNNTNQQASSSWTPHTDKYGNPINEQGFLLDQQGKVKTFAANEYRSGQLVNPDGSVSLLKYDPATAKINPVNNYMENALPTTPAIGGQTVSATDIAGAYNPITGANANKFESGNQPQTATTPTASATSKPTDYNSYYQNLITGGMDTVMADKVAKAVFPTGATPTGNTTQGATSPTTATAGANTTIPPAPTNFSLTGGNLAMGSTGNNVSQLQNMLTNFFGGNLKADGIYGIKTQLAVKEFQRTHTDAMGKPLLVDGIVGPKTTEAMNKELSQSKSSSSTTGTGANIPPADITTTDTTSSKGSDLTPAQTETKTFLQQQDYDKLVTDLSKSSGLDTLKTQITDYTKQIQDLRDKKTQEANDISNNPWISENLRLKKIGNLDSKYSGLESNLLSTLQLTQKQYEDAQQSIQLSAKMQVEQANFNKEYDLKVQELAYNMSKPVARPTSYQEYALTTDNPTPTGYNSWLTEDANRKISIEKAGAISSSGLTTQTTNTALKLSDDYEARSKDFYSQREAYNRIVSSASDPSAAGDLALIFNYMKVLDPGSTVREGEFANAQNAGSAFNIVGAKYNKILNGERLTQQQRTDFVNRATKLFDGAKAQQDAVVGEFNKKATQYGVPPELVVRETAATGKPTTPKVSFSSPEWMTNYNYDVDIKAAKDAINRGADVQQIRSALLKKYKTVTL